MEQGKQHGAGVGGGWNRVWGRLEEGRVGGKVGCTAVLRLHLQASPPRGSHKCMYHHSICSLEAVRRL